MSDAADLTVTVTRSAGSDGAVLVFIDTEFEPNGSDGGPGLRVLINDSDTYLGQTFVYDPAVERISKQIEVAVRLDDIAYTVDETTDETEPEPQVWCAEHGKSCPYGCIR